MKNLNFPGLPRVLVTTADDHLAAVLRGTLQAEGVAVEVAATADAAVDRIRRRAFDIVMLDARVCGGDGLTLLPRLRQGLDPADVVLITSEGDAVAAMREGAADVIAVPVVPGRVLASVRRGLEVRQMRAELNSSQERLAELTATDLVGLSRAIRGVHARIADVAQAPDSPVLVLGEPGTGKELAARRLHASSARRHGPFITVNCAALSESQLEVELFGNEPGAFADGAREGREGLLARAAGGSLYLDAIHATGRALQARVLRVLQERAYRRVGGLEDRRADVRVIASSTRDLRADVEAGRFREDLFLRLDAMHLEVPPLRERPEDVPLLAHYFLDRIGRQVGKALNGFTEEATETLCEYAWPGNVRELESAILHAAVSCEGGMIDERHLPRFTGGLPDGRDEIARNVFVLESDECSIRVLEEQLCRQVLEKTRWNISRAASLLGINRTTLYNKIKLYGLGERPERQRAEV
jgi:DNA-binding NtrC family response regulator